MKPSSRDRISVDLHGLKAALFARARAAGVSPSNWVRSTLAAALGHGWPGHLDGHASLAASRGSARTRLCLRMSRDHAQATLDAARRAGLSAGDYVGSLVVAVPAPSAGGSRADHVAALIASSAELATFSRDLHRLTALLGQADVERARRYREMLDGLDGCVRGHLRLAARVLGDLQPRYRNAARSDPEKSRTIGDSYVSSSEH